MKEQPAGTEQPTHPFPKPRRKDTPHNLSREIKNDIVLHICERIAEGEFLINITREENMPCPSTFRNWLRHDGDFASIYNDSLIDRIESLQAETIKATREPVSTYKDSKDNQRVDPGAVSIHNARIRTLQWLTNALIARQREQVQDRNGNIPPMMLSYLIDEKLKHEKATGQILPLLAFKDEYFRDFAQPPLD